MTEQAQAVLDELMQGNERFRTGQPESYAYSPEDLLHIAKHQHPKAAIIACADSRVSPEVVFNQPLGAIFASRVPGNVASDSAKWMLEIAIGHFQIPLIMVMGHTGCLAIGQLLDGDQGGAGGLHRFSVLSAVYRAKSKDPADLYRQAIEENVAQTVEHLARDFGSLRGALRDRQTSIVGAVYEMETGEVKLLDIQSDVYGAGQD
jgi:carbonic anhydrase